MPFRGKNGAHSFGGPVEALRCCWLERSGTALICQKRIQRCPPQVPLRPFLSWRSRLCHRASRGPALEPDHRLSSWFDECGLILARRAGFIASQGDSILIEHTLDHANKSRHGIAFFHVGPMVGR